MWMQRAAQDAGVCERPAPQARWRRGREVGQAPCGFTAGRALSPGVRRALVPAVLLSTSPTSVHQQLHRPSVNP